MYCTVCDYVIVLQSFLEQVNRIYEQLCCVPLNPIDTE